MRRSTLLYGAALSCLIATQAQAQAQPSPSDPLYTGAGAIVRLKTGAEAPAAAAIGGTQPILQFAPLTWNGITLYGTIDAGFGYMSHGQALSDTFPLGRNYLVGKDSGASNWGVNPNALGNSSVGVRGKELLFPGVALVFDAQTGFLPTSGRLSNGLASLVSNAGVPADRQSGNGDSSRAGQIFNSFAFAGFTTAFGTLTYGRQNTFTLDGVTAYDPVVGSTAFSLLGAQSTTAGAGATEDARLDSSLKYLVNIGPIRTGVIYQFDDAPGKAGRDGHGGGGAVQVDVGTTIKQLSLDAIFSQIDDAIGAASLTRAQLRVSPPDSLAATASDNTSVMLLAKYSIGSVLLLTGYENIRSADPEDPIVAGSYIHGYQLAVVNNTAYVRNKLLQVAWAGARYKVTKKLSIYSGYYHEHQNSYAKNRCTNASHSSCSGNLDAVSLVNDYRLYSHFELYAGAMLSRVSNGLSSGFMNRSNVDPTVGGRLTF
nr:porin [uncultured Lichenicoccus sp.]